MKILVVEDERDILDTIVDTIEIEFDDKLVLDKAENGVEALEKLADNDYELIITDLNMPKMNGIQLIENLQKMDKKFLIIVFTGHGDIRELEYLKSLGINAMIKKPFIEDLIDELNLHYT